MVHDNHLVYYLIVHPSNCKTGMSGTNLRFMLPVWALIAPNTMDIPLIQCIELRRVLLSLQCDAYPTFIFRLCYFTSFTKQLANYEIQMWWTNLFYFCSSVFYWLEIMCTGRITRNHVRTRSPCCSNFMATHNAKAHCTSQWHTLNLKILTLNFFHCGVLARFLTWQ